MQKKGFTLIELLVVVAIIALLISILLPSLSRARELAKRAVCASNLRGLGQGMYIYSNDNQEWFPVQNHNPNYGNGTPATSGVQWVGNMGRDYTLEANTTNNALLTAAHPSRSLFLLIISGNQTAGQFICPSASDTEDDMRNQSGGNTTAAQPGKNRFDFKGYPNTSYSYQMPFGRRGKPKVNMDARMPLSSDKSPYFTSGNPNASTGWTPDAVNSGVVAPNFGTNERDILATSNEKWKPYNSQNHGSEGQEVLFADGHADFGKKPIFGVNNDNIFTVANGYEAHNSLNGVIATGSGNTYAPLTNTDSFLVP